MKAGLFRLFPRYLWLALLLLLVEIGIALWVQDGFLRPYGGDFLAVIFLFFLVKGFVNLSNGRVALLVFLIACAIEFGQYLGVLRWLGWERSKFARIFFGSSFEWLDIGVYALGLLTVLGLERMLTVAGKHSKSK